MKKAKFFDFIKDDIPEKEWEAQFIVSRNKAFMNYLVIIGFGFMLVLIVSAASISYLQNVTQCEIEFRGKMIGNFEIDSAAFELNKDSVNEFNISEVDGKIYFKGPCRFLDQVVEEN